MPFAKDVGGIPDYIETTWANKPTAASSNGALFFFTDIGTAGSFWRSNGSDFLPTSVVTIARSGLGVTVTGAGAVGVDTAAATITIPAGVLGTNGMLRITPLWTTTGTTSKTVKVKLGSSTFQSLSFTSNPSTHTMVIIRNRNSASSQIAFANANAGLGNVATANNTGTENTATDLSLTITASLGVSTDAATLEGYSVELIR